MGSTTLQIGAILAGILSGSVMIAIMVAFPLLSRLPRFSKNQGATQELGFSLGAILVSFLFGAVALFVCRGVAPTQLVWFGVTEVVWFMLGVTVYALRKIRQEKKSRDAMLGGLNECNSSSGRGD
jgi:hypothetical protein